MDNVKQYEFGLVELGALLLKKQSVTEGLWEVGVKFAISAANAGPDPQNVMPTMLVSVEKIILTRAEKTSPLTIDAAKI